MKTSTLVLFGAVAIAFTQSANSQTVTKDSTKKEKVIQDQTPFDNMDLSWINGNDRRDSSIFHIPYFSPEILVDANATYSFANPIDHTVVGSTALARDNEMELSQLGFGGDFNYKGAHARFMTQFGTRDQVVPRNDYSVYRGQYDLADAYRYLSEAYAGYHFNVWHGINIDAGLFMSYIGLNSYYQAENWDYQASYTSDNTPWFFNGLRTQIFPSNFLKIELWVINGWQSYATFNDMPGFGGVLEWHPNENIKMITNNYLIGYDDAGLPGRRRFHSDNSIVLRYFHKPKTARGITQMAFSLTGDIGFEKGDGVNGFNNSDPNAPAQYFESVMFYNRIWFAHGKLAWLIGGGYMTNPGRYLVLLPTGDASALPNPYNPTQTLGTHPFTANPGDQFNGWDCSTNISWLPNQSFELKLEYVHRNSSVPYFAGQGGVTSPTGYTTTPVPATGWTPDLVRFEDRLILAFLFRI